MWKKSCEYDFAIAISSRLKDTLRFVLENTQLKGRCNFAYF